MENKNFSLSQIKRDLSGGNIISAQEYLNHYKDTALKVFKEQRLLLILIDNSELVNAYLTNASCVSDRHFQEESNYVDFIKNYIHKTSQIHAEIEYLLQDFTDFDIKSFFFISNFHLETVFNAAFHDLEETLKESNRPENSVEDLSSNTELTFHHLKGRLNDALFAQINLVNLFCKFKDTTNNKVQNELDEKCAEKLVHAFNLVGYLNCYQYALDQVSCMEWVVEKVYIDNDGNKNFKFSIVDTLFQKARELGLQRNLSSKIIGRTKERWLKSTIKELLINVLKHAWNYYQDRNNILINTQNAYLKTEKQLLAALDELGAEDELLVGSSEISVVFSHYISYGVLISFVIAASGLKDHTLKKKYVFSYPEIPLSEIKKILSEISVGGHSIDASTIDHYICTLPLDRHLDIFKQPFYRGEGDNIVAIEHLVLNGWVDVIRTTLMQGGRTADLVGKIWEEYIADILRKNHWTKVLQGLKIKKNGKILTDIDIIAKRDDVLLIVQLKVYYGTGVNNYEQWKFRKKLEHASQQIKASETALSENFKILNDHFDKLELAEIKRIQSVVMTNSHYYNGWICNGVPVMSTGSLMQIINGASVKFTDKDGKVFSEKNYASSKELTVDEFLQFIKLPLDWRIGPKNYEIKKHIEILNDTVFEFPIFEMKLSES